MLSFARGRGGGRSRIGSGRFRLVGGRPSSCQFFPSVRIDEFDPRAVVVEQDVGVGRGCRSRGGGRRGGGRRMSERSADP